VYLTVNFDFWGRGWQPLSLYRAAESRSHR
jgi:hypothetical protein